MNPDGSTTFESSSDIPTAVPADEIPLGGDEEEVLKAAAESSGVDPALYVLMGVVALVILYFLAFRKKAQSNDEFFSNLDGDKVRFSHGSQSHLQSLTFSLASPLQFNLNLPKEVDEYYAVKEKCEQNGWAPGQPVTEGSGPHKVLAQALMKRAIADIPIVQHIQKESAGMNKLYSQSMCSVKQWRSYQAAEAMVSSEVEEVQAEADQIEPGWASMIWRQAMQYHTMLKQKHEAEAKQAEEQANKRRIIEQRVAEAKANDKESQELKAQKAAEELIKAEEREKESKKAFAGGKSGMKKGFLDAKPKKKK